MDSNWVPVISTLIGGIIGLGGAIFSTYLHSRADRNKELLSWAIQAAIEDFKADQSSAKDPARVLPISSYTYFHYHFFKLLEEGRATPEYIEKVADEASKIVDVLEGKIWRNYLQEPTKRSRGLSDEMAVSQDIKANKRKEDRHRQ